MCLRIYIKYYSRSETGHVGQAIKYKIGLILALSLLLSTFSFCQIQKRDSLLNVIEVTGDNSVKVDAMIELSKWFINADFPKAVEHAAEAVVLAKSSNDSLLFAGALTQRALLHWYDGDYENSIALNNESIRLLEPSGSSQALAKNYYKIAMNYYYMADYVEAIQFHKKALSFFRQADDKRQIAAVLNQIGLVYHQMGNYPLAIQYLHEFSRARQDLRGYQGRTYNLGKSTPYFRSDEYFDTELALQLKALDELKNIKDNEQLYLTYLNVADAYKELGEHENALRFHKKAADFALSIGLIPEYIYLGNAFRAVGKIDSAVYVHQVGLEAIKLKGARLELLNVTATLGKDYRELANHKQALGYFLSALDMTTGMNNKLDIVINAHRVANALLALGRVVESKAYAENALNVARNIGAKTYIRDSYQVLAEVELGLNNFENAFLYQKAYTQLSDSLVAGEAQLQFAKMQAQFELDKKNRDIELLGQEKELQEAAIKNKDQLIIGFIIVLALSILLAISAYLRYRQKIRANKILIQQKHQIEVLLSEVHHRVKNNLQVISSLLSIQSDQLVDVNARMAVLEGQSRVQAMGLIHENIYRSENFAFIQMDEYLGMMTSKLVESFGFDDKKINVNINAEGLSVDVDTAIHIGLIINELVTNSLKHAFNSIDSPCIWITLRVEENNLLALEVRDNGNGLLVPSNQSSFGLKLVKELAVQMGGTLDFIKTRGFGVSIKLKKFNLAA